MSTEIDTHDLVGVSARTLHLRSEVHESVWLKSAFVNNLHWCIVRLFSIMEIISSLILLT